MISLARLLVLLALSLGAVARAAQSEARAPRWILDPRERAVGEVLELALEVPLAAGARLEVDSSALEADPSWALFDAVRRERVSSMGSGSGGDPSLGTPSIAVLRWSLASLEPGERQLPTPALSVVDASGARASLAVPSAAARFTGVLAEGEDEPRAPLGFRPVEAQATSTLSPWLMGAAGLVLGALAALWFVRRRRRSAPPAPPTVLEQLAALEARPVEAREQAREVYYALTALVREHVDERLGEPRPAATDAEWIRGLVQRAPAAACEELAALLREAEPVKYAAHHPTHWAVRESFQRARRALELFDDATRRAA